MKKLITALLAAALAVSLAGCGGNSDTSDLQEQEVPSQSHTEEELLAAAQNAKFDGSEKTVQEYLGSGSAITDFQWMVVTEENTDEEKREQLAALYDPAAYTMILLEVTMNTADGLNPTYKYYFAVDHSDLTAEYAVFDNWGAFNPDDNPLGAAAFMSGKDRYDLDEMTGAAASACLPNYPDRTLKEYAELYTMVDGSAWCQMTGYGNAYGILDQSGAGNLDTHLLAEYVVDRSDLKYAFYIAVEKATKASDVVAVRVTLYDSDNGLEGNFQRDWVNALLYGEDLQEIADIFVEAATWMES